MHIRTVTAFVFLGTEKIEDSPFNTSEDELIDHDTVSSIDSKVETTASTVISLLDVKEQLTSEGNNDPFDDKSDDKTSADVESLVDDKTLKSADGNTNSEEKMLIQRSRRMMIMKKLILYFYQTQRQVPFGFDILVKCYNFSVGKLSISFFICQNSIRLQISLMILLQALKMIHFLFG